MKVFFQTFYLATAVFFAGGQITFAQDLICTPTDSSGQSISVGTIVGSGQNQSSASGDLPKCINNVYRFAIAIGVVMAIIFIIIAGYLYIFSGGNEKSVGKAKEYISSAILGLAILISGLLLLKQINPSLLGIHDLSPGPVELKKGTCDVISNPNCKTNSSSGAQNLRESSSNLNNNNSSTDSSSDSTSSSSSNSNSSSTTPNSNSFTGSGSYEAERQFCLNQINSYRASKGKSPLRRAADLEAYANEGAKFDNNLVGQPHAHFVATNGGGVADSENSTPGWGGWNLNIQGSVMEVVRLGLSDMWAEGPGGGHYENILGDHTEVGCGIYVGGDGSVTFIQDFR